MPLREKKPEEPAQEQAPPPKPGEEELKKEDSKEQSSTHKKEEMSYDVGSEGDRSDDEHKKIDQKKLDRELNQVIYNTESNSKIRSAVNKVNKVVYEYENPDKDIDL